MKVFIDTWGWIAISDEKDSFHNKAIRVYRDSVLAQSNKVFTSDFVLMETITSLRTIIGHSRTVKWIEKITEKNERGLLTIIPADRQLYQKALQLLFRYDDKPDISFVDFTSFVIMQENDIVDVFSGDNHFEQVNLGFRLIR